MHLVGVGADGAGRAAEFQELYAVELYAGIQIEVPPGFESAELGALFAEIKAIPSKRTALERNYATAPIPSGSNVIE